MVLVFKFSLSAKNLTFDAELILSLENYSFSLFAQL